MSKNNKAKERTKRRKIGIDILTLSAQRATADAVYQHLVDLTYQQLKDVNWIKIVEDFITENFPPKFISKNNKNHKGKKGF